jgi:hypothetical protein
LDPNEEIVAMNAKYVGSWIGLVLGFALGAAASALETGDVCVRDHVSGLSCTGTDVTPTGLVAVEVVEPCGSDVPDTALVVLDAVIAAGTSRQDLGIYLGLTGGSALDDDVCGHARLDPPLTSDPTYGDANGNAVPDIRGGPWWNAEPGDGVDDCGDIVGGTEAIPIFGTPGVPVEIACVDTDEDGLVDVDVCVSWSNGTNDHCTNTGGAIASVTARCQCARVDVIGLPEPATLPVLVLGALWLRGRSVRVRRSWRQESR